MAGNDLELGAEWAAHAGRDAAPSRERLDRLSTDWTEMRAAERRAKEDLDATGHQDLAEERERLRRAGESGAEDAGSAAP